MRGRIAGLKKSNILKSCAIINLILALFFILFSILYLSVYDLWFFIISFFLGVYIITKAFLFRSDSSCYLGSLLCFIAISGVLCIVFSIKYPSVLYLLSTAFSSLMVLLFFKQKFHLLLSFIFIYEALILYLFLAKNINLTIFLVLNSLILFIFFVICVIMIKKLKHRS